MERTKEQKAQIQRTEEVLASMTKEQEAQMQMIKELLKSFGQGFEKIPNICGFKINVMMGQPVTIDISILTARDGMANFIKTFPLKYQLLPANEVRHGKAMDRVKEASMELNKNDNGN